MSDNQPRRKDISTVDTFCGGSLSRIGDTPRSKGLLSGRDVFDGVRHNFVLAENI